MKMKFCDDAYPHRNNRRLFPRLLAEALTTQFTRIVNPHPEILRRHQLSVSNIRTNRCRALFGGQIVCERRPEQYDREIVRAILDAWMRRISDRYLDFSAVRMLMNLRPLPTNRDEAYERLNAQGSGGAVRFVSRKLSFGRTRDQLPIFGESIGLDHTYNHVYSALLVWDVLHCMGLVDWLIHQSARMAAADGGERIMGAWPRATLLWTQRARQQPNTIYRRLAPP